MASSSVRIFGGVSLNCSSLMTVRTFDKCWKNRCIDSVCLNTRQLAHVGLTFPFAGLTAKSSERAFSPTIIPSRIWMQVLRVATVCNRTWSDNRIVSTISTSSYHAYITHTLSLSTIFNSICSLQLFNDLLSPIHHSHTLSTTSVSQRPPPRPRPLTKRPLSRNDISQRHLSLSLDSLSLDDLSTASLSLSQRPPSLFLSLFHTHTHTHTHSLTLSLQLGGPTTPTPTLRFHLNTSQHTINLIAWANKERPARLDWAQSVSGGGSLSVGNQCTLAPLLRM